MESEREIARINESRTKQRKYYEFAGFVLDQLCKWVRIERLGSWEIVTSKFELVIPGLPSEFEGFRLIQISDFHFGSWLNEDFLKQAVDRVNSHEPDLVVITGDFVSFYPERYSEGLVRCLSWLQGKEQTLAVLGNHDHWSDAFEVRKVISRCHIKELSNHVQTIKRGKALLYVAGVDDYLTNLDDLDRVVRLIPPGSHAILLAHEPDFAEVSAPTGKFQLQLSGHSHGSQIRIPLISRLFLPFKGRRYPSGLYQLKDMYLYTNRGLGTTWLNLRYNCPPEITVIELKAI